MFWRFILFVRTATAEGQIMAQVLSTFSRLEQSRFEAFRRATFPRDAIAKYVAHCLIEEQHRPVSSGDPMAAAQASLGQQKRTEPLREPILSHVVAPGQAEDITIVVSTLAKAYAQRLVTAARRHANVRAAAAEAAAIDHKNSPQFATPTKSTGSRKSSTPNTSTAITPDDIMKAFEERRARGLDPGFFLQPWQQSQSVLVDDDIYQQKRLAALHAQEQYDKRQGGPPTEEAQNGSKEKAKGDGEQKEEASNQNKSEGAKRAEAVPMDLSSPSGAA
jgi:hypothetical protein